MRATRSGTGATPPFPYRLPYGRCPSDGWQSRNVSNYAGSMGPQCMWGGGCGSNPNPGDLFSNLYCNGLKGQPAPGWTIQSIPEHGNYVPRDRIPAGAPGYGGSPDNGGDPNIGGFNGPNTYLRGVFNRQGVNVTFAAVSDGLSNTIFVGETLPEFNAIGRFNDNDAMGWWASDSQVAKISTVIPINYRVNNDGSCADPARSRSNWSVADGFKSNHSGGANFLFGDGSARFIADSVDMWTYQRLGCRNDGLPVNLP